MELKEFFEQFQSNLAKKENMYRKNLENFFSELSFRNMIYLQYKIQSDKLLSSDFSFFRYMGTDENSLSNYIGMLLNTKGEHGQQKLFLELFIKYLEDVGLEIPNSEFQVHREYYANGRIDIFLHFDKTAIIIENKPFASDMKDQLKRYYDHISRNYDDIFIVYLSPGSDPASYSIPADILQDLKKKGKFRTINLNKFAKVYLGECFQKCESLKMRFFLADFKEFLESTFKQNGEEANGRA